MSSPQIDTGDTCHDAINLPTDAQVHDEDGITLASYTDHPLPPWVDSIQGPDWKTLVREAFEEQDHE